MSLKLFLNKFLALLTFLAIVLSVIIDSSAILASFKINVFVLMALVGIFGGSMVPITVYAATKVGFTNCLLFELFGKTFYIRPWNFFMPNARSNYPRKVYGAGEMPAEVIEDIKNSKMNPKHDHLNKYYDDTH